MTSINFVDFHVEWNPKNEPRFDRIFERIANQAVDVFLIWSKKLTLLFRLCHLDYLKVFDDG